VTRTPPTPRPAEPRAKRVSTQEPLNGASTRKRKRRLKSAKRASKAKKVSLWKRRVWLQVVTKVPARITLTFPKVAGCAASARTTISRDVFAAIVATKLSRSQTLTASPSI